ncbi:MAG: helix-turn-helix transcriptional regulator [Methylobacteriaceae bacterium]|nr:helix-turn-helix transcriptional regulator [Methylobacteriaceae bacterium]
MLNNARPVGDLLREWRHRRRMSQLDLACEAEISTRHLSFLETGRSVPSREMVLHLADQLGVPLRERNLLLNAAGYAPLFPERPLADPALETARTAVDLVIKGHEPYPALAVDRHWTLVARNEAVPFLIHGVEAELLREPANVLRLSLHPGGLAPRIANLAEWRTHLLERLRRQIDATADPVLVELMRELQSYPAPRQPKSTRPSAERDYAGVIVPFELATDAGILALFGTTTIFGTPVDITLSELALECFYPADAATAQALHAAAATRAKQAQAS